MDVIIREVVHEVLDRLEKLPKKALVIFTGDFIGFDESVKALNQLKKDGWTLKVLLSQRAERVLTKELIKNALGSEKVEIYGESAAKEISYYYADIDKVIFPVLTMNTAVKIALGIADNLVTNVIAHCLMKNIPIMAAQNACDPLDKERIGMGMGKGPVQYINNMKNYLRALEDYGIKLVSAKELYNVAVGKMQQTTNQKSNPMKTQIVYQKRVLTRADVVAAFHINRNLILSTQTIITDAAKDTAKNLGVKIAVQEG